VARVKISPQCSECARAHSSSSNNFTHCILQVFGWSQLSARCVVLPYLFFAIASGSSELKLKTLERRAVFVTRACHSLKTREDIALPSSCDAVERAIERRSEARIQHHRWGWSGKVTWRNRRARWASRGASLTAAAVNSKFLPRARDFPVRTTCPNLTSTRSGYPSSLARF